MISAQTEPLGKVQLWHSARLQTFFLFACGAILVILVHIRELHRVMMERAKWKKGISILKKGKGKNPGWEMRKAASANFFPLLMLTRTGWNCFIGSYEVLPTSVSTCSFSTIEINVISRTMLLTWYRCTKFRVFVFCFCLFFFFLECWVDECVGTLESQVCGSLELNQECFLQLYSHLGTRH